MKQKQIAEEETGYGGARPTCMYFEPSNSWGTEFADFVGAVICNWIS